MSGVTPVVCLPPLLEEPLNSVLEGVPDLLQDAVTLLLLLVLITFLLTNCVMGMVPLLSFPLVAVVPNN